LASVFAPARVGWNMAALAAKAFRGREEGVMAATST
jgi:hypothetical protein